MDESALATLVEHLLADDELALAPKRMTVFARDHEAPAPPRSGRQCTGTRVW